MLCAGKGSRFQRHIDNTAGDGRVLTVLVYLNSDWQAADGGALRVYTPLNRSLYTPPLQFTRL
jgi:Rps23 Pro-64 3,4-dihydroxylase Tpa1-like proline 4-hydroxylase